MSMKLTCGEFVGLAYTNDDELREFTEEILAENAKLRELVRDLWLSTEDYCRKNNIPFRWQDMIGHVNRRMRELGIEGE